MNDTTSVALGKASDFSTLADSLALEAA